MKLYQRDTAAAYFLWMYILISPLAIIVFIHHYHSCDNKHGLSELRNALDSVSYQQGILQKLVQEYYNKKLGEKTGIHLYGPAETGKLRQERESVEEKISWIEGAVKRLRRAIIDQRTFKRLTETTSSRDLMQDLWNEVGFAKRLKQCQAQLADCDANVNKINSTNVAMTLKLREVESECYASRSELSDVCSSSEDHSLGSESWMSFTVSGSFLVFITTVLVVLKRAWRGGHHLLPSLFTVLSDAKALICRGDWKNDALALKQSKEKKEHSLFAT